eukprot:gene8519-9392_t
MKANSLVKMEICFYQSAPSFHLLANLLVNHISSLKEIEVIATLPVDWLASDLLVFLHRNEFCLRRLSVEGLQAIGKDSGWKLVHGDVFRAPEHLVLFSAVIATGWQFSLLLPATIISAEKVNQQFSWPKLSQFQIVWPTFIACDALSSAVAGYVSGSYYKQFFSTARQEASSQWRNAMFFAIVLFPVHVMAVSFVLNVVFAGGSFSIPIPLSVAIKMVALQSFVALPFAMFGRHWGGKYDPPCRVNSIPRPIPQVSWMCTWLLSGHCSFLVSLLLFNVILALVIIFSTIVAVYFTLNNENYHWQWLALGCAASPAFYVFLYFFYFSYKTQMTGSLVELFLFCCVLFFMWSALGLWGASLFVHKIYRNVKID